MLKGQCPVHIPPADMLKQTLTAFLWFHDSVNPFSINIFLFRKTVIDSNYITL